MQASHRVKYDFRCETNDLCRQMALMHSVSRSNRLLGALLADVFPARSCPDVLARAWLGSTLKPDTMAARRVMEGGQAITADYLESSQP